MIDITKEHVEQVKRLVRRFCQKYKYLEQDEAFGEALMKLTLVAGKYDPSKGVKFSTFMCVAIRNHLLDWAFRTRRAQTSKPEEHVYIAEPNEWSGDNPEHICLLAESMELLSGEAQYLVDMILRDGPDLLLDSGGDDRRIRGVLVRREIATLKEVGVKGADNKAWTALREVKDFVAAM